MDDTRERPPDLTTVPRRALHQLLGAAIDAPRAYEDLVACIHDEVAARCPAVAQADDARRAPDGVRVAHAFPRLLSLARPLGQIGLLPPFLRWAVIAGLAARDAGDVRKALDIVELVAPDVAGLWESVAEGLDRHAAGVRRLLGEVRLAVAQAISRQSGRRGGPPPDLGPALADDDEDGQTAAGTP